MSIFEGIVYGIVSGIAEFLPVSSQAHESLLKVLFGYAGTEYLRELFIHAGLIAAVIVCCGPYIGRLRRDRYLSSRRFKSRGRHQTLKSTYDLRLLKTALMPMLVGLLLYGVCFSFGSNTVLLGLFFVVNGVILYVPEHFPQGNKDASKFSGLDGILLGICGALSVLPGISRIGCILSAAVLRGADRQHALNWALLLSIPALIMIIIFDFIGLFAYPMGSISFGMVVGYILSGMFAFGAGCCGILLMRFLTVRGGYASLAFYSWGAAMLSFILYFIV